MRSLDWAAIGGEEATAAQAVDRVERRREEEAKKGERDAGAVFTLRHTRCC